MTWDAFQHRPLAQHLIGQGADPNATGFLKQTPLIIASIHHQLDLVAYFANLPAIELNRVDDLGRTALFFAGRDGNLDILNILLDSGADSTIGNMYCRTPLHMAARHSHFRPPDLEDYSLLPNSKIITKSVPGKMVLVSFNSLHKFSMAASLL